MNRRRVRTVLLGAVVLALSVAVAPSAASLGDATTSKATPPPDAPDVDVTWHTIQQPDGTSQLVAVARPPRSKGQGPFPVVVTLHGGSGLGPELVEQAARLAKSGFVVVSGCWLAQPPWCEATPDPPTALAALEEFGRAQPGVRKQRMGVFGLSAGAGPTFNYPWGPWTRALAVDSGVGVDQNGAFITRAPAPVLLMYGTNETNFSRDTMESFTAALRSGGVDTRVEYLEGGGHAVTIPGAPEDTVTNAVAKRSTALLVRFLRKQLGG